MSNVKVHREGDKVLVAYIGKGYGRLEQLSYCRVDLGYPVIIFDRSDSRRSLAVNCCRGSDRMIVHHSNIEHLLSV